jgi:hypothetical protein
MHKHTAHAVQADGEHRGEAVSGAHKANWRMRELEKERCPGCWLSTNRVWIIVDGGLKMASAVSVAPLSSNSFFGFAWELCTRRIPPGRAVPA